MIFAELENGIDHLSSHRAEIACSGVKFCLHYLVAQTVKPAFECFEQFAFVSFSLIRCNAVAFLVFGKITYHLHNNFGTLLQVCVDDRYKVALCVFQSGINCGFFSEISGERNKYYLWSGTKNYKYGI